jgi:hypothetical protein
VPGRPSPGAGLVPPATRSRPPTTPPMRLGAPRGQGRGQCRPRPTPPCERRRVGPPRGRAFRGRERVRSPRRAHRHRAWRAPPRRGGARSPLGDPHGARHVTPQHGSVDGVFQCKSDVSGYITSDSTSRTAHSGDYVLRCSRGGCESPPLHPQRSIATCTAKAPRMARPHRSAARISRRVLMETNATARPSPRRRTQPFCALAPIGSRPKSGGGPYGRSR